ncbi:hypothetical protein ES708_19832 [subsurface metagenome]
MADEPVGEVKALVVYELTQFTDTEGRSLTRLCPIDHPGEPLPVRYRGRAIRVEGKAQTVFEFEILAESAVDAFEKFDAQMKEAGAKLDQPKVVLAAGTPKIDAFRAQRLRRFRGNGG